MGKSMSKNMGKKWSVLAVALVLLIAFFPVDAAGKKKKKKKPPPPPPPVEQVVEGAVMFPAVTADTAAQRPSCFSGVHRRATLQFGDSAQGYFGYNFDIDPATAGGTFILEPSGGADFDITFYVDFGSQTAVGETVTYETRGGDPEAGEIPPNMPKAIVCMFQGVDAGFKYTGTGPAGVAPVPGASPSASGSAAPSPSPSES